MWWSAPKEEAAAQAVAGRSRLESAPVAEWRWGRLALLASVLVILLATLSPGQWTQTEGRPQGLDGRLADVLLNVLLFAPFGAVLGRRGRPLLQAVVAGTLLSAGVELAQLWVPGRTAGLSDVMMNTIGTLAGWTLWRTSAVWGQPSPRVATRLALVAAVVASATVGATGLLLEPALPTTPYFGHWTPEFGRLRVYDGHVLEASVGDARIESGLIQHFEELRQRIVAGEPLRVVAVAGAPPAGLAPIVSVNDSGHEVLLLGADGEDIVYRVRTRGASLGLDSPDLRVAGALRGVHPGQRLAITVTPQRSGYCVDVNGTVTCGVGFTAGMGWALLAYGQGMPPALHGIVSALWLAGLALPIGYWSRARWPSGLAPALFVGSLVLLPAVVGLAPTTPGQLAGAVAGLLAGVRVRRRLLASDVVPSGRGRER